MLIGVPKEIKTNENRIALVPAGAESFAEALRIGAETFHALKAVLHERGLSTAVGDEGGFAPDLAHNEDAIKVMMDAIERTGRARRGQA